MGEGHNRLLKLKEKEDDGSSRRFVLRFDEFSQTLFPCWKFSSDNYCSHCGYPPRIQGNLCEI